MKWDIHELTSFEKGKAEKSKKDRGLLSGPITSVNCRLNRKVKRGKTFKIVKKYLGHKYSLSQHERNILILVRDKLGKITSTLMT